MTTISHYMGDDHRRCDQQFVAAERAVANGYWPAAGEAYAGFHDAMEHHFAMEEEVLFPAFEAASGSAMGPTQVMRMEHRQMRELFASMAAAVAGRDADSYLGDSETLLILMQQHNMKEENILYPMCERALPEADVLNQMQSLSQ